MWAGGYLSSCDGNEIKLGWHRMNISDIMLEIKCDYKIACKNYYRLPEEVVKYHKNYVHRLLKDFGYDDEYIGGLENV